MSKALQSVDHSKRNLFRGKSGNEAPLRPPFAIDERLFTRFCTGCEACISACPEGILKKDSGFVEIDFSLGSQACTFCQQCLNACETNALMPMDPPWNLTASINQETCLPFNNIMCQSCADACEVQAIRFDWLTSIPTPTLDTSLCTGCGACQAPCPQTAIIIGRHHGSKINDTVTTFEVNHNAR